jgi:hypothetical protein
LTGEGADVSGHGRDGDDATRPWSAAIATCPRRARRVGILVPASVPERAFDALVGTWATETTHPVIVVVVPGSLEFREWTLRLGQHLVSSEGSV